MYRPSEELEYSFKPKMQQEEKPEKKEKQDLSYAKMKKQMMRDIQNRPKRQKEPEKKKGQMIPGFKQLIISSGAQSSSPSSHTVIDLGEKNKEMVIVSNRPRAQTANANSLANGSLYARMPQFDPENIKKSAEIISVDDEIDLYIQKKHGFFPGMGKECQMKEESEGEGKREIPVIGREKKTWKQEQPTRGSQDQKGQETKREPEENRQKWSPENQKPSSKPKKLENVEKNTLKKEIPKISKLPMVESPKIKESPNCKKPKEVPKNKEKQPHEPSYVYLNRKRLQENDIQMDSPNRNLENECSPLFHNKPAWENYQIKKSPSDKQSSPIHKFLDQASKAKERTEKQQLEVF